MSTYQIPHDIVVMPFEPIFLGRIGGQCVGYIQSATPREDHDEAIFYVFPEARAAVRLYEEERGISGLVVLGTTPP